MPDEASLVSGFAASPRDPAVCADTVGEETGEGARIVATITAQQAIRERAERSGEE